MNVTFTCPACDSSVSSDFEASSTELICSACGCATTVPPDAIEGGEPVRCLVCPSADLFVRKDFPQVLGVAVVVFGGIASSIAWYFYRVYLTFGILFAIAAIDVLLYKIVGESLTCYRCHAQYRGVAGLKRHGAFELETHERYRQQAARLFQRH